MRRMIQHVSLRLPAEFLQPKVGQFAPFLQAPRVAHSKHNGPRGRLCERPNSKRAADNGAAVVVVVVASAFAAAGAQVARSQPLRWAPLAEKPL